MATEQSWWAKMERAKEHIYAFEAAADAALQLTPEEMTLDGPVEVGEGLNFEQKLVFATKALPARLSVIAGDAFHSVRTALDHIAVHVTGNHRGAFPIVSDWATQQKTFENCVKGAPAAAVDVIRSHQPFTTTEPTKHPLALLQVIDNCDKHRALVMVGSFHRAIDAEPRNATGGAIIHDLQLGAGRGGSGKQKLFSFEATVRPGENMEIHFTISSEVTFAEPGDLDGENVARLFERVFNHTRNVLTALEKFA